MKDNVVDLSAFKQKLEASQDEEAEEFEGSEEEQNYLISDEQLNAILYALMKGRDNDEEEDEEHLGEEISAVVEWAHDTLFNVMELNQILMGNASVRWDRETGELRLEKLD